MFYSNAPSNRSIDAQKTRDGEKEGVWSGVFTPLDCTEETAPILCGHGIAQMPALICIHSVVNHVHSGNGAALPTTPPAGLGGDRGACPRSLLERRWSRTAGVAIRTCIDQSVC